MNAAKKKKDHRRVGIVLITEKPFEHRLEPVFDMMDKFFAMVSANHQFELGEQHLSVIPDYMPKAWERSLYSAENWFEAKVKIRQHPYAFVMSDWNLIAKAKRWETPNITMDVDMCAMEGQYRHLYRHGYGIQIYLKKEIYEDLLPLGFLSWINKLAEVIGAMAGFVDYTAFGCYLLCSEMMGMSSYTAAKNYEKHGLQTAIGYFWRTLITGAQIDTLGGMESILCNAPCSSVDIVQREDEPAVWLQMTGNLLDTTPADRLRLREYLQPVLPELDMYRVAYAVIYDKKADLTVLTSEEKKKIKELAMPNYADFMQRYKQNRAEKMLD
ncbi:MAG: hypothetical protein FWF47_03340 [Clostridia bacterium]|nr:hypothetical protein [Clostridia bacterium]